MEITGYKLKQAIAIEEAIIENVRRCNGFTERNEIILAALKAMKERMGGQPAYDPDATGLKHKYNVYKAEDGSRVENCFVLRPGKDAAAVEALRVYAEATENEQLADDILKWIGDPDGLTLAQLKKQFVDTDDLLSYAEHELSRYRELYGELPEVHADV